MGVLFQFDPVTNNFIKKIDFNGTSNGSFPTGSLKQATNGKLYGMTSQGGASNFGVFFTYDYTSSSYTKIFDFNTSFGGNPKGSVIQAADGNLYGMTSTGNGVTNLGCIFKYDFTTLIRKVGFLGMSNGSSPLGNLTEGADGALYGITERGGSNDKGVLFQYNYVAGTMIKKHDFSGTTLGAVGDASLLQASNGKIYGISVTDGIANAGILFEYNLGSSAFTKKIDFNMAPNGRQGQGSLMKASNGLLYGLTDKGGLNDGGVLFQYNSMTKTLSNLYDFNTLNGINPKGELIEASNGNLYGMCYLGGTKDYGVIFQYNPISNLYSKVYDLDTLNSGGRPYGSLMQASDGMLYGMTKEGGLYNQGTLFQFNPTTNVVTKKLDFAGSLGAINGSTPLGSLMQATDGYLYGMTSQGGPSGGFGNIFRFDINTNVYTNLFNFTGTGSGQTPYGSLMQASDGKLYGMTYQGGANGNGVLFQYDIITSSFINKFDFNGTSSGNFPINGLIESSSGKLYGLTTGGGLSNMGVLFQFDISTSTYLKKIDFNSTNGRRPFSNLIKLPVTYAINTQTVNSGICAGSPIYLTYSITGTYGSGNIFTVQLSDPNGSFAFPVSIGTSTSVSSGTISAFTPSLSIQSSNYKVRVVSSNPFVVGNTHTNNITIYAVPTISVNSGTICSGSAFIINPSGANTYTYSSGSAIVSPTVNTSYNITGTSIQGCISSNTAISSVTVNSTPTISVNSGSICNGNTFTLSPNGASTYSYSGGSAVVSPSTTTDYTVTGIVANGCSNNAVSSVTVNSVPTLTLPAPSNEINCLFSTADCSVTGASTYTWSGSGIVSGANSNSVTVNSPGTYSVTGSNGLCTSTDTIAVISNTTTPTLSLTPSYSLSCAGSSLTITANATPASVTYLWDNSATTPNINVSPTVTTVYSATVTDNGSGCYSSETTTVNVYALPILTITGTTTVCLGTSTSFAVNGGLAYTWSTGQASQIIYVNPTITTTYTVTGTDFNNCSNTETVSLTIDNTCADVWPGDANSDGTADNLDVLELGLHYTQSGTPRASVSNTWQPYFANNWSGTISNGSNLNHSDCNGDGTIDDNDTLAIYNNYGLTHAFKTEQTTTVNPQLSIVPDQAMVVKGMWGTASVYLGDASANINNINGAAFTVDFDKTLIEPNSIWIEYINSFIDSSPSLYFRKLDFTNGKIFTATTHTVSNNVNGFGKIAVLHYQILSSLSTDNVLNLSLTQANQSNASGLITPLSSGSGTLMAIGASVGIGETLLNGNVMISPNPMNGILNITFSIVPQNARIEIYNTMGALVISEMLNNKLVTIETSKLSSGIYFVKVLENNKLTAVRKIVKE